MIVSKCNSIDYEQDKEGEEDETVVVRRYRRSGRRSNTNHN